MTQIVTILKFIGDSAIFLAGKLSGPDKENFAGRLAAAMAHKEFVLRPPVMYYAQYLDQWSMFDVFEDVLPQHINTGNENNAVLSWCELPQDRLWFTTEFKKHRRQGYDKQWLYSTIFKAVRYWERLPDDPSIIVVSRYVIEGTVTEGEAIESTGVLPDHVLFR